jgi:hypothetical protein
MARPDSVTGKLIEAAKVKETVAGRDYDYDKFREHERDADFPDHLPSRYKLPNHITFSDESVYADEGAGQWRRKGDKWHFKPGATNLKHHSMDALRDYFNKHEPDSVLEDP